MELQEQEAYLARIGELLAVRMEGNRRRYTHSLGVADTAERLARAYGVDPFLARAAGLLHDWDKVLADEELVARAARYGIRVEGSLSRSVHLLHGPVAAYELPQLFPELPEQVFQAIARHTVGACDMEPLDMVVYVADAIEPARGDYAEPLRVMVGERSLVELFSACVAQGLSFLVGGGRYIYPPALAVYNTYVAGA